MTKIKAKNEWFQEVKNFYHRVLRKYDLAAHEVEIVRGCCDQLHRYQQCKRTLDKEGLTFQTASGQIKKHPLCEIERQSWAGFLSGVRTLSIDDAIDETEVKPKRGRPIGIERQGGK